MVNNDYKKPSKETMSYKEERRVVLDLFHHRRLFAWVAILVLFVIQQSSASNQETGDDKEAVVIDNPSSAEGVDRSDLLIGRMRELGFRMYWERTAITVGEMKELLGKEDLKDARFTGGSVGYHTYLLYEGGIQFIFRFQFSTYKELGPYRGYLEGDSKVVRVTAVVAPSEEEKGDQKPSARPKVENGENREEAK